MSVRELRRLAPLLLGLLLVVGLPISPADAGTLRLGGLRVALPAGTTQVVTVDRTRSWHARVVLWERGSNGWRAVVRTRDGRVGYGGLMRGAVRKQGTGTTPLGTYRLLDSFGTHARRSDWRLPHRQTQRGDYWVQDNGSAYYNRYRNKSQGGFRWWLERGVDASELLTDYPTQYEYAVNTAYNLSQVRHRGAGIFLHVNGRGATAGCVSVPRRVMQTVLARLDPVRRPVIAIGR